MVDVDKEFRAKIIKFHSSEVEKDLLKHVEHSLRTKINSTLKLFRIRQNRCFSAQWNISISKKKRKKMKLLISPPWECLIGKVK